MRIQNIVTGWVNYFKDKLGLLSPEIKELAEARLRLCNVCPNNVFNVCKLCGCPVKKKARVLLETCPDNRWKPVYYLVQNKEIILLTEVPPLLRKQFRQFAPTLRSEVVPADLWEEFLSTSPQYKD